MTTQNESLRNEVNETFNESFLKPEIKQATCIVIDGNSGIVFVDKMDYGWDRDPSTIEDIDSLNPEEQDSVKEIYRSESEGGSDVYDIEVKEGFMYRLSASGYMDCTDWCFAETEEDALKELLLMD